MEENAGLRAPGTWGALVKYPHRALPTTSWWYDRDGPMKGRRNKCSGHQIFKWHCKLRFATFYVGNYFLVSSKLLHIKLRGKMDTLTNKYIHTYLKKIGREMRVKYQANKHSWGLDLEVEIVFHHNVKGLFLVHKPLPSSTRTVSLEMHFFDIARPTLPLQCR